MTRRLGWLLALLGVIVLLSCMGMLLPIELAFYLAGGWLLFLKRTLSEVTVDWSALAFAGTALGVFAIGLHAFLRWLAVAAAATSSDVDDGDAIGSAARTRQPWLPSWTVAIVSLILMLFVAGISMVGVIHQTAWLATSPEPLVEAGFREIAYRNTSLNNLKMIGLGLKSHDESRGGLPAGATVGAHGQLLHGWMAQLLPFMELQQLHQEIDFKAAWDAPQNREAMSKEVQAFVTPMLRRRGKPSVDERGFALTEYAANVHVIGGTKPLRMADVSDGLANTILAGEAYSQRKPWGSSTNWRDPAAGLNKSPAGFGGTWRGGITQFIFADGHYKQLSDDIDPEVLRAMATPQGGEDVGDKLDE